MAARGPGSTARAATALQEGPAPRVLCWRGLGRTSDSDPGDNMRARRLPAGVLERRVASRGEGGGGVRGAVGVLVLAHLPVVVLCVLRAWTRPGEWFYPVALLGAAALAWRDGRALG